MSQPYLGQLLPFSFGFPPKGWAFCAGQVLSIQQNTALFSLLGTTYGGNGIQTFALPDLRSRVPIHNGAGFVLGQTGGEESVTLNINELPAHSHAFSGTSSAANVKLPVTNSAFAQSTTSAGVSPGDSFYASPGMTVALNANTVAVVGGSQPHTNLQPYLVVNWCIALAGIFPSRN
jgi:microcystin-dependent protein